MSNLLVETFTSDVRLPIAHSLTKESLKVLLVQLLEQTPCYDLIKTTPFTEFLNQLDKSLEFTDTEFVLNLHTNLH